MTAGFSTTVTRHQTETARPRARRGATRLRRLFLVYSPGARILELPLPAWPLGHDKVVIGRTGGGANVEIDDTQVSRHHVALTHNADLDVHQLHDLGSKNGTRLNGRAVVDRVYVEPGSVIRVGDSLFVYAELELNPPVDPTRLEGSRLAEDHTEAVADLVAPSDLPVLILGPTGAGKERIAARIHEQSRRPGKLVSLNCAAFTAELLPSELFGHARGAFSGANEARTGLFVHADRGTLFLDEIAELPLDQQAALLRVIQEKRVRPVGANDEIAVDVRLVTATHQDLAALERAGRFRADLHARLEGVRVPVRGLCDRREEILRLFVELAEDATLQVTPDAAEALLAYAWPKNIRELRHTARATAIFAKAGATVGLELLPGPIQDAVRGTATEGDEGRTPTKQTLEQLLREHQGNVSKVAEALGARRPQLYRWMRACALNPDDYRDPST